ncbi:MAG: hypothetical protein IPF66_14320 [Holophagales bacterium]|nr:hypothetical protein [Holophagales bacterium]
MKPRLEDLRYDPGLEQRSPKRMVDEFVGAPDPEEVAGQSGVEEVELRHLHEALPDVGVERGKPMDEKARLQEGHPRAGRVVAEAAFRPELREVQELTGPSGRETNERRKPPVQFVNRISILCERPGRAPGGQASGRLASIGSGESGGRPHP